MSERMTDEEIEREAAWCARDTDRSYLEKWEKCGRAIRQLRGDLAEATAILRAILAADARGQGQPFAEAMERARAFVEG